MRLGVLLVQDAPLDVILNRFASLEEWGADLAYVADHTQNYRDGSGLWFDGWTVLAAAALHTKRLRIGTLVTNPIIRPPALVALEAVAVDHLSGGRLELGMGTGIAGFDHKAVGSPYWSVRERVDRFAEFVEIVDGLLRTPRGYSFSGRYFSTDGLPMNPGSRQTPRPPITVGGQAPTVRRVAARFADCWNTHGPYDRSVEEILDVTARQNAEMDEACARNGRQPSDVRRSLLLYGALDPFVSDADAARIVRDFGQAGVSEFVFQWSNRDDGEQMRQLLSELGSRT